MTLKREVLTLNCEEKCCAVGSRVYVKKERAKARWFGPAPALTKNAHRRCTVAKKSIAQGLKNPVPDAVMDALWIAIGELVNYEFNQGFTEQRRKQHELFKALSAVRDLNHYHPADEGLEVECVDNGNPYEQFCLAALRWDVASCGAVLAGLRSRNRQLNSAIRKATRKIHEFLVATSINPLIELGKGHSFRVKLTAEDRRLLREMRIKDCPQVRGSL